MAGTVILRGPAAGDVHPLGWCAVCAGQFKNDVLTGPLQEPYKTAFAKDGEVTQLSMVMPEAEREMRPAVAFGIYTVTMPMVGLVILQVPLCWSHLMPLDVSGSKLQMGSAMDAAALAAASRSTGPGGAADLRH